MFSYGFALYECVTISRVCYRHRQTLTIPTAFVPIPQRSAGRATKDTTIR